MNTKYNVGDKVLIKVMITEIRIDADDITYYIRCPEEFGTTIKEKNIYGPSETKLADYLAEQMEDPEFRKEYEKADKEFKEKYYVTEHFKMELRDVIYRKGEPACVISKNLGFPGDCITKIINGYTKKMSKDRHDWICTALGIDPEV